MLTLIYGNNLEFQKKSCWRSPVKQNRVTTGVAGTLKRITDVKMDRSSGAGQI